MEKEKKYVLVVISIISILFISFILLNSNNSNNDLNDLNSDNEFTDFNYFENDFNETNLFYNPKCYFDEKDETISCDNGILRIRPTKAGIIWFDFFHAIEEKWYLNKNNLNLVIKTKESEWLNSELSKVQPKVTILSEGTKELKLRYDFVFSNKAEIYLIITMKKGEPEIHFKAFQKPNSIELTGFQWHITFGHAEAVSRLHFDSHNIFVNQLPQPFPGGKFEVQYVEFFNNLNSQKFVFMGQETFERDENNPEWMDRVLGLRQEVEWLKPMRSQDVFAFEARDVPWQRIWKIPKTTPWIEGLWFIRNESFFEGDELIYRIDNLEKFLP
jgi:hypothetical protein